jgi:MIP family channel proteins
VTRRLLAEFVGTFFLVLLGPGAVMVEALRPGSVGAVGIALTFAFAVSTVVFALGPVSGAHINPAVTIALWSLRRIPATQGIGYIGAQLAGAVTASVLARVALGAVASGGATLPRVSTPAAFALEALMSLLVILVVLATDREGARAGNAVIIGMAVGVCALFGGPLTGASMNPARSFGPALVNGAWSAHWVYWVAPVVGMLLGARISGSLHPSRPSP